MGQRSTSLFMIMIGLVGICCWQNLRLFQLEENPLKILQYNTINAEHNVEQVMESEKMQYSTSNHEHDSITTTATLLSPIPVEELVESDNNSNVACPRGLTVVHDTHLPISITHSDRYIPKIIHITSKSRCVTDAVLNNIEKWRFLNYSLYFHDDAAVQRLFEHNYTRKEFPKLRDVLKCVTNGATKSDLWRYVVLSLYGGVYTDIDNSPVKFQGDTIRPEDDSFFVLEGMGMVSQYFIASSPGHPLIKLSLQHGIDNLKRTTNVMQNSPAQNTGPRALKNAFISFQEKIGIHTSGYIEAGIYWGANNRSTRVVGTKQKPKEYIDRSGLPEHAKREYYKALGIKHFRNAVFRKRGQISCLEHLNRTNGTDIVANYTFNRRTGAYDDQNAKTGSVRI